MVRVILLIPKKIDAKRRQNLGKLVNKFGGIGGNKKKHHHRWGKPQMTMLFLCEIRSRTVGTNTQVAVTITRTRFCVNSILIDTKESK